MNTKLQSSLVFLFAFVIHSNLNAQSIQITNFDGGSIVVDLGDNIKSNDKSSLHRSWYVLNDASCPFQLNQTGIKISWSNLKSDFVYEETGTAKVTEKVQAYEIRYVLFDVFGEHLRTLASGDVLDISATSSFSLKGSWSIISTWTSSV